MGGCGWLGVYCCSHHRCCCMLLLCALPCKPPSPCLRKHACSCHKLSTTTACKAGQACGVLCWAAAVQQRAPVQVASCCPCHRPAPCLKQPLALVAAAWRAGDEQQLLPVDHSDCVGAGCAHQAHGGHLRLAGVRPPVPANTQHHVQQQPGWRQCCAGQGGGRRQQEGGHPRHLDGPVAGIC